MPREALGTKKSGEFLVKKAVFLLTSSVGPALAEKLVSRGLEFLRIEQAQVEQEDIPRLAAVLEPSLAHFVGAEKARRLAAALRVSVGGGISDRRDLVESGDEERYSSRRQLWRRVLVCAALVSFAGAFVVHSTAPWITWGVLFATLTFLPAAAALLAHSAARQFTKGEPARRLWLMVALVGVADSIVCTALTVPRAFGAFEVAVTLTVTTAGLMSLSRIVLARALWMMISVYRESGLVLQLRRFDYAAIGALAAVGVMSVLLTGSVTRSVLNQSAPDLISWVGIAGFPQLPALVVATVFGVMVWRYAQQMGGGLIAKAWRSFLLYGVVWLARLGFFGALSYVYGWDSFDRPQWVTLVDSAAILASGYLLFLGASYQHEVCTGAVSVEEVELEALA